MELRDLAALRWNAKVLGATLVRELYASGKSGPLAPIPNEPCHAGLTGGLCRQADIESDWLRYWCGQVHWQPQYHRKIWELAFVLQALLETDMLQSGRLGLGFAVGTEPLPSYFASKGISIVATDLPTGDSRAEAWNRTGQHSSELDQLYCGHLLDRRPSTHCAAFGQST